MNQAVKFAIDTIIVAMIPKFEEILNEWIPIRYISCIMAAVSAVLIILVIEKVISMCKNRKLSGEWFEYIPSTPQQPFALCKFEENFFTGKKQFSGINYNKNMGLEDKVEFKSPELMETENGFVYTIKTDARVPKDNRIGIGKYYFNISNEITSMDGYFIDVNSSDLKIKSVTMFKANRKFYEKLGLKYNNRKQIAIQDKWKEFKFFLQKNRLYKNAE